MTIAAKSAESGVKGVNTRATDNVDKRRLSNLGKTDN